MSLATGTHLGGYEILALLGVGGMGEVYLARDGRLGREVALKVLPADLAADPGRLARFEREARTIAALNHPNIVTLHSIEDAGDVRFLTMERVTGRPLSDLIEPQGMPLPRLLELAVPIADAMAAAHKHGIVHRDLKPANVMVNDEGRVKVLDFGLAKPQRPVFEAGGAAPTQTVTAEGRIVGTVPYMAPEQLRGEPADPRADIFSFGALLYEMATGLRPFRGDTTVDTVSAILREDPEPLQQRRPDLPLRFAQVVAHCLEKEVHRRAQSAADVRQELQGLADEVRASGVRVLSSPGTAAVQAPAGLPVGDAQPGALPALAQGAITPDAAVLRADRAGRWRRPWLVAAAAMVVIAAAAAFVVPLLRSRWAGGAASTKSLAVLPFANLMHDGSQDYFVDGMHEALITDLAKLGTIRVLSRNSVLRFKDRTGSLKDVASELGVDAIIEGSVLRAGDKVRITAQLISGRTDEHLWADSYDRELQDVLSLLSEVSRAIAGEVQSKLGGARVTATAGPPVQARVDPRAWEAYLRGRHAFNYGLISSTGSTQYLFRSVGEARTLFQEATTVDPRFADAWSGLAMMTVTQTIFGVLPTQEGAAMVREAARKAIEIDPSQGEAYGALGIAALFLDWDFEQARPLLEKAIALNPHDIHIRHFYADYLIAAGRPRDSLAQVRIARDHNPNMPWAHLLALTHLEMASRNGDEIIEEARRLQAAYPRSGTSPSVIFRMASTVVFNCYWRRGRYEEALRELESASQEEAVRLRALWPTKGPRGAMKALADEAAAKATPRTRPLSIAVIYADAEDRDATFAWLEKAFAARQPQLLYLPASPSYDFLRDDPRYQDLIRRIGMPIAAGQPK
jgi:serine/threonine-protein kinase